MGRSEGIDPVRLLKEARARSGLSQRALARRADTAQSVVARIELGETNPTVETLNRLLNAAGSRPVVSLEEPRTVATDGVRELRERVTSFFGSGRVHGVASVYLFGSAARGRLHRESDLDVALLLDRHVYPARLDRSELRVRLSAELSAATGLDRVDLVVLNDLPPLFGRVIVRHGIRLLCTDPDLDHAFVRDVQLRAADLEPFLRRMRAIKLRVLTA